MWIRSSPSALIERRHDAILPTCHVAASRRNIDCTAQSTDDGRFRVDISIEDTSVYSDGQTAEGVAKMSDIPSFRTFQTSNTVILKDGQSSEFTAAATGSPEKSPKSTSP
jgi:hypothetical protein